MAPPCVAARYRIPSLHAHQARSIPSNESPSSARRDRCGTRWQLEAMRRLPDAQNLYPFIFDGSPGFGPFRDTLASLVMPGLAGSGGGGGGGGAAT